MNASGRTPSVVRCFFPACQAGPVELQLSAPSIRLEHMRLLLAGVGQHAEQRLPGPRPLPPML
eukprot:752457-Hanusia_phi.AAC.1